MPFAGPIPTLLTSLAIGVATLMTGAPASRAAAPLSPPGPAIGHRTAAVPLVGTNPAETTPQVLDGRVEALAQVGDTIIAGGTFTQVRSAGSSTTLNRTRLFAYNRVSGVVSAGFVPVMDGEVTALAAAPGGTSVFVGGLFKTVNGAARAWLARLEVATGKVVPAFAPVLNGQVSDVDLRAGTLYATGWFSTAALQYGDPFGFAGVIMFGSSSCQRLPTSFSSLSSC